MVRKGLVCFLFLLLIALCIGSEASAGGKVFTLMEDVTIPASTAMDLPSFAIGNFQYASILATADLTVSLLTAYASDPGLYSEPVPKQAAHLFSVSTGGASLQTTSIGDPLRVRGPYLLSRIVNNNTNPATITIKVYLSK